MIPVIYDMLLVIMMFVLYKAGRKMTETEDIFTPAGYVAIIIYTLNEGLRFGRGIDYNLYGMSYEEMERTGESSFEISFKYIAKMLIAFDIPWQGYVILMSCFFILATIILLKVYKEALPYALPLFVLFSMVETENMARWYLAFSFVMIGLAFLLRGGLNIIQGDEKKTIENRTNKISFKRLCVIRFWFFSVIACTFHIAILPLPITFYILYYFKRPLLSPIWTLLLYFAIAFSFQTEYMLQFVNIANILSMTLGESSERFAHYGDRAEYWLTGGMADTEIHSPFPDKQELLFLCVLIWLGYKIIKDSNRVLVYAYNLFVLGFLINPIARQIELVHRYNQPFLFFRAIILACVIKYVFVRREVIVNNTLWILSLLICINIGRRILIAPFYGNPEHFLYVWDIGNRTYDSMYATWIDDINAADSQRKKQVREE